ncbi:mothers against decapentaplegic homolog 6 [Trichonephila inaurata madagascariensis]|uniref:Mothers against decapentaplegic homolog n=1 Tax=Trichonephila inaurata madagascariensis TaxID=2747483 RepID=A0A8X7BWV9_9ARAC|nr:mothers against decapentaplegic homolog 6 [Trichonephila inaurata madagascariensis]
MRKVLFIAQKRDCSLPDILTATPSFLFFILCVFVNVGKFFTVLCTFLCLFVAHWATVVRLGVRCGRRCKQLLYQRSTVNAPSEARTHKLCFNFMFRSRRSCLIKRLSRISTNEAPRTVEAILRNLELSDLETLSVSVESQGAVETSCIPLPMGEALQPGFGLSAMPHVLFCQLWRWADLRQPNELTQLPNCHTSQDPLYICANPYHWSRLCKPDTPPPPYTTHPQELPKVEEDTSIPSDPVSPDSRFSSNLSGSSISSQPWCKLAYWELSDRVGRLLPFSQSVVNVFADLPHSDGLCLQTLTDSQVTNNLSVKQTRTKIGKGLTIFKMDHEVWVYNRSEYPMFVNSPTLDPPNTEKLTVYKLLPGYSIKIFDFKKSRYNQRVRDSSSFKDGPFDPNAVRISFVKGWGSSRYSRRFITSCPCWLEVMFHVNR